MSNFESEIRHSSLVVQLVNLCSLNSTFEIRHSICGKVQERLNWQHWKCCEPQKGSVGSNPTLSAILAEPPASAGGFFDWNAGIMPAFSFV